MIEFCCLTEEVCWLDFLSRVKTNLRAIRDAVNHKTLVHVCNRAKWIAVNAWERKIFAKELFQGEIENSRRIFSTSRSQEIQKIQLAFDVWIDAVTPKAVE